MRFPARMACGLALLAWGEAAAQVGEEPLPTSAVAGEEVPAEAPPSPELAPADLALDPVLRTFLENALAAEAAGDLDRAARLHRLVLERDPTVATAILGLGRVLEARGEPEAAVEIYGRLPADPDAVGARARLLEGRDPGEALVLYRRLETLELGSAEPYRHQARLLAGSDPLAAAESLDRYLGLLDGPPHATPDLATVVRVVRGLKAAGQPEAAVDLVTRVRERWPEAGADEELASVLDRIAVEQEAARLGLGGAAPLPVEQRPRLEQARRRALEGDVEGALAELRALAAAWPRVPEVWALLGETHAAQGAVREAERALVAATVLAPDEAEYHARLGRLLADRYGGRRHAEAAVELHAALALRPAWPEIQAALGRVLQESGRFGGARDAWRAALEADPHGPWSAEARQALEDLTRTRPAAEPLPEPEAEDGVPDPARQRYHVARVYKARGEPEPARAEAEAALALAPGYTDALVLLAALELEAGRPDRARERYGEALRSRPEDARLHLALGSLERAVDRRAAAREHLARAAAAGAAEAWYLLADMAAEDGRWAEARTHLDAFFARSLGGIAHEPAVALQARVDGVLNRRVLGGALAAVVGLALVGGWTARRRTGGTLRTLLEADPGAAHDVARRLAAIRHEVIKHNTTLLPEVADRLEEGEGTAGAWAAERLFGGGEPPGVAARFDAYLAELEAEGRRRGLRLNLRHRDPVLAPMHRAMRRLARLEGALRRGRGGRRLARDLREVSRVLNQEGYAALGRVVGNLSLLVVDGALVAGVYRRVAAEPGLHGRVPAELEVVAGGAGLPVRMFRQDLEDVLANLLRNAATAVAEELPPSERRVGVALAEELDPVTGLETVAIRIRDTAPRPLAEAILRGRRIERGLGLAADLLARNQGVMNVEPEPGWAKAVVVRLSRAETAEEDA